jgi:hypothetical protein
MLTGCPPKGDVEYGKALTKEWQGIFQLKPEDGEFRWFGYPVDNFGAATFYEPRPGAPAMQRGDMICDTWNCVGVPDDKIPTDVLQRLRVNGNVAEGSGAEIKIDDTKKSAIGIKLLIPGLAQLLHIDAGVDWDKSVTTNLTLGRGFVRAVRPDPLEKYIRSAENKNDRLKDGFMNGRLSYVAADIVAEKIEATVTLKKNFNTSIKTTLDQLAAAVVPKDSNLTFTASRNQDGTYTFKVDNPVVLAVQLLHQRGAGKLDASARDGKLESAFPAQPELARTAKTASVLPGGQYFGGFGGLLALGGNARLR